VERSEISQIYIEIKHRKNRKPLTVSCKMSAAGLHLDWSKHTDKLYLREELPLLELLLGVFGSYHTWH